MIVDVWREWGGHVLIALAGLPVAALAVAGLAAWRIRRGRPRSVAWRRSLAEVGMVAGTLPWVWMILTPLPLPRQVFLIPFSDLPNQLDRSPWFLAYQVGGNLLVFAALGFFTPMRYAALCAIPRVLALGAVASIVVESLQYALDLGRVTSIDDVMVNALGAALAAAASRRWWVIALPSNKRSFSSGLTGG